MASCHLKEIQVGWIRIRVKSKVSNEKWTRGDERTSPLDQVSQISLGEGKREREQMEREREREREGFRE